MTGRMNGALNSGDAAWNRLSYVTVRAKSHVGPAVSNGCSSRKCSDAVRGNC